MSEPDNFALVPRPPGTLEKGEPGAKRVLSGMVGDALALATKGQLATRRALRIVQVNDEPYVLDAFGMLLHSWFPDITVLSFDNAAAALEEVARSEPDLLITDDRMPGMSGDELCRRLLERKFGYPIIVNSAWPPTEQWVRELAERGLGVSFLPLPCTGESLRKALAAAGFETPRDAGAKPVEIAGQLHRTRPPRIVVVEDVEGLLDMTEMMIRDWFKDATVLLFLNSTEAWQELLRTDPDLLITRDRMHGLTGEEMVRRLMDRKATYPIIVTGGWPPTEQWVREFANRGMDVTFLLSPFTPEQIHRELLAHVGPSDNPQHAKGQS